MSWDDDATVQIARAWLSRQCDGVECAICGAAEGDDHEPTDPCGIVAALLLKLTWATTWPSPLVVSRSRDHGGVMAEQWMPARLAPENVPVLTKIDDSKGPRNEQPLKRKGRLWWYPDGSMYVYYYTPTHWKGNYILDSLNRGKSLK